MGTDEKPEVGLLEERVPSPESHDITLDDQAAGTDEADLVETAAFTMRGDVIPDAASDSAFVLPPSIRTIERQMRMIRPLVLRQCVRRAMVPCCALLAEVHGYQIESSEEVAPAHTILVFTRSPDVGTGPQWGRPRRFTTQRRR